MKVFLHTWSLGQELLTGACQPAEIPKLAHKAGFQGVEWLDRLLPSYKASDWKDYCWYQEENGQNAALSLSLEIKAPPTLLAEQVDRTKRLLGQCRYLNIKTVRIAIGGKSVSMSNLLLTMEKLRSVQARDETPLGRLSRQVYRMAAPRLRKPPRAALPPPATESDLQSAAWSLQPLARQARDLGLRLGLENHFGLTSHPSDMIKLLELTGEELGVCLDLGNFSPGQDNLEACRLLAPHTVHVHFKTFAQEPEDDARQMKYRECLQVLKEADYAGGFSVEYHGPGDGLAGAEAGARLLRKLYN